MLSKDVEQLNRLSELEISVCRGEGKLEGKEYKRMIDVRGRKGTCIIIKK